MTKQTGALAWVLMAVLSLIWGSSFILIKRGLDVFSAGEVGAIRIIAASTFLLPFAIKGLKNVQRKDWVLLLCVGLFGSFIPAFLFAKAQTQIPSSVAGILNALTPLFTMIIGAVFYSQKFTAKTVLGLIIGFGGTVVLILAGTGGDLSALNYYALLVVLATIFYGANLNLIKFKIPDLRARTITSISLMLVGPLAIAYLFIMTPFVDKLASEEGAYFSLGAIVLLGVMGTAIALILFNQLVKITTPIFTSSVTYLIPIVAVIWGILDGEQLFLGHYLGMAAIIFGVYLANRKKKPIQPAQVPK
ncbi:DMT family transporter [Fulvivirga sp.]|uniref:DMT family transporter n=1 Tax=Fulvivirga sp. TaxID=1931237 RepID=UPI0032ED181B